MEHLSDEDKNKKNKKTNRRGSLIKILKLIIFCSMVSIIISVIVVPDWDFSKTDKEVYYFSENLWHEVDTSHSGNTFEGVWVIYASSESNIYYTYSKGLFKKVDKHFPNGVVMFSIDDEEYFFSEAIYAIKLEERIDGSYTAADLIEILESYSGYDLNSLEFYLN